MRPELLAAVGCAATTAALCAGGPAVIGRLPEPGEGAEVSDTGPGDGPAEHICVAAKLPYVDVAAAPALGARLAAAGAVVGAVVGWRLGAAPVLLAWTYLGAASLVLAYVDGRTKYLPTRIIAPSYVVVVALLVLAALLDHSSAGLIGAALGWLVMGGFYFLLWFVHPAGIGYGDVRLAGLLGLALGYVGWSQLLAGIYAGFLLGGVGGGLLALSRIVDRRRYPFGPFMVLGALVGVAFGGVLGGWYTTW